MNKKSRRQKSLPQKVDARQVQKKGTSPQTGGTNRRISAVLAGIAGLALAGFLLVWGFSYYRRHYAAADLNFKNDNLLFITIDTLRADHVGAYGYDKIRTPNLDRLASEGFLFRRAISQIPLTLPSHTSIFTGTFPAFHGVRDNGGYFVSPQSLTLAEILKQHGYKTSAFVSAFVLDSKWGLDQGFDTYYDDFDISKADESGFAEVQRQGGLTNEQALQWLESVDQNKPFFTWIHYYDPHDPYEPPEPFRAEYSGRPYDGEIAYADSLVGQVLDVLKKRGMLEKTVIVITGDHGEGLGQHHELNHAMFIYDTTLHVPLIMKLPGNTSGEIEQTVQHVDIVPTLLDLLGIEKPQTLQGRSLIALLKHQDMKEVPALSESLYAEKHYGWSPLYSLTTSKYKYIDAPRPELFNLQEDGDENNNLAPSMESIARVLHDQLGEQLQAHSSTALKQAAQTLDIENQEMLKALGYVSSGPSEKMKEAGKNIDPKDKIELVESLHQGFRQVQNNQDAEAIATATAIISKDPEIVDAHLLQGMAASRKGDFDQAIRSFQETLRLRPDHQIAIFNLALAYRKSGQVDKSMEGFREVLRRDPHYVNAMVNLAQIYTERNEPEKALPYYQQAIGRYNEMLKSSSTVDAIVSIRDSLSGALFSQGKISEAEEQVREIIKLKPNYPDAHYNMGQIYEARGMPADAAREYQQEIQYNPTNFKAYNDYALLLRQQGQFGPSVSVLEQAVRIQPESFASHYLLADSLMQANGNIQEARANAEQAVSLNPSFRKGFILLVDIYSRLGMSKEASQARSAADRLS